MDEKRYAIFELRGTGQGGWDICGIVTKFAPSTDKQSLEEVCHKMNKYKPNSWVDFCIYEINEKDEPMCHGKVIK